MSFYPVLSADAQANIAYNNAWVSVNTSYDRPYFAQAVYNVGPGNSLGLNGFQVVSYGSGTVTGPFQAVLLTAASGSTCTVTGLTALDGTASGSFTVAVGTYIYNVRSLALASGTPAHLAIAYR